ncbi:sugar phosphate isomerase/epimerase family protein [Salibacterium halotolerans]|uniref:Sugar phosphate isomerase/epimerase n=1 Tax=Salibacterium halotolerans TaxID=1884432 RepID=A0A1I5X0J4_9BACI|nr:sugar phosphate isomerase/epimerase family protein [Salibacterium halotolerans]SFQ25525.1 Sugar phosphate isomerase/epimerase [Salibacterium halotolerans]
MSNAPSLSRLSLNQITTEQWSLEEAVQGCLRHDVPWISVWRHKIHEIGLSQSRKLINDAGLKVSSVCRGGMFPAPTPEERRERIEDNKRAIEEAAELGTDVLVLVCGPAPDKDIDSARKWVEEGIEELIPFAREYGIKLGIEPLHPMYAADRSVISTLGQANSINERMQSDHVGVVVDVFHVWWDPNLYREIERAQGSILGFHVSDWVVPLPDIFKARGMMGDGVIELRRMRQAVEAAGYHGPIEVEIINDAIWNQPGDDTLKQMKERYTDYV